MWGSHLHSAAMICSCPNFAPWNKPAAFILHPVYVSSSSGDPAGTLDMFLYILLDTHQISGFRKESQNPTSNLKACVFRDHGDSSFIPQLNRDRTHLTSVVFFPTQVYRVLPHVSATCWNWKHRYATTLAPMWTKTYAALHYNNK